MFVYFLENNAKFCKPVFRLGYFACTMVKPAAIAVSIGGNKDPLNPPSAKASSSRWRVIYPPNLLRGPRGEEDLPHTYRL